MNKFRIAMQLLAITMFTLTFASVAQAQATRTWVSGEGNDADPCSRTAPCKTFAGAIIKTAEGGEIDVLDPGGYGTVTINKALTIDGGTGAGWASVMVSAQSGITVNVTTGQHVNDAIVVLRNISFNGYTQGSLMGSIGVNYVKAAQLKVENCQFQNFSTNGIRVSLGSTVGNLTVQDCVFDNVNTVITSDAAAPAYAVISLEHNRMVGSAVGLNANTNTYGTVRDSYFGSFTGANGAVRAGAGSHLNVIDSTFANSAVGVNVAGGTVRLTNNEFLDNATAISGSALSANDNKFRGNGVNGTTLNTIVVK